MRHHSGSIFRRVGVTMFSAFVVLAASLPARGLTIVLDFIESGQGTTSDYFGHQTSAFDVTAFGFAAGQSATVQNDVLSKVTSIYHGIPDVSEDAGSPLAAGDRLDINFVIGNIGSAPGNGDAEYYYMQVGEAANGETSLGVAGLNIVRYADGSHHPGIPVGTVFGPVFTDNIAGMWMPAPGNQLTSGDLDYTGWALAGTAAHEIGHALSLEHVTKAGANTPSGTSPTMGTGALDLPNEDRISKREFAYSAPRDGGGTQYSVSQLIGAVGTVLDASESGGMPEPTTATAGWLGLITVMGVATGRRKRSALRIGH